MPLLPGGGWLMEGKGREIKVDEGGKEADMEKTYFIYFVAKLWREG